MIYARIDNGLVVELVTPLQGWAISDLYHSSLFFMPVPDGTPVAEGWTYADGTFASPASPPPISLADQARLAIEAGGLEINFTAAPALSGVYAVDTETQADVVAIVAGLNAGMGFPGGVSELPWPDVTGAAHAFASAQFVSFAAAIRDYVYAVRVAARTGASLPSNVVTIT
jgi:hypothetical protein